MMNLIKKIHVRNFFLGVLLGILTLTSNVKPAAASSISPIDQFTEFLKLMPLSRINSRITPMPKFGIFNRLPTIFISRNNTTITPTQTLTPTPTPTQTPAPTNTPVPPTSTVTPTQTPTQPPTPTNTLTPTPTVTGSPPPVETSTPTPTIPPTLVAYWKMDEGDGITVEDSSGNGNHITIIGSPLWSVDVPPTIVSDSFSLLFDGSTYGQLVNSLNNVNFDFTSGFTIEAWIKPTQVSDSAVLSKFSGFMMWFKDGTVINYINGSQASGNSNLVNGLWHHVAMTWDGANQAIYVDGVREGDLVSHTTPPSTGGSLLLGSYNPAQLFNFIGNIDEVKVYNYARSQSEILSDAGIAGSVVINEIMWSGSNISTVDEWVELKNNTSSTIDLTNWSIENLGDSLTPISIPSGVIIPNGYFLIANNLANNSIINVDPDFQTLSIELINTGEQLILKDSKGSTIDTANDSGLWFAGDNAVPKKSMSRNSPSGDGALSANWHTSTTSVNLDGGASEFATPQTAND